LFSRFLLFLFHMFIFMELEVYDQLSG